MSSGAVQSASPSPHRTMSLLHQCRLLPVVLISLHCSGAAECVSDCLPLLLATCSCCKTCPELWAAVRLFVLFFLQDSPVSGLIWNHMLEVHFYFVAACTNIKSNVRICGCKRDQQWEWGRFLWCGEGSRKNSVAHLNMFPPHPPKNLFSSPVWEVVSSSEQSVIQMMGLCSVCSMNRDFWVLYREVQ